MGRSKLAELRRLVAQACRILALQGLAEDVLGHVSARAGPEETLVRSRGPAERGSLLTTPADVHVVRLDGEPPTGPAEGYALAQGCAVPAELPIHTELLRRRPEVQAIAHAHPPSVMTADLAGLELRPVVGAYNIPAMQQALAGIPVHLRAVLIHRTELASEMAAVMGEAQACALRGYGVTTARAAIAEAVIRALNLESLARVTLGAAGHRPADLPTADVAELPDLGRTLNEHNLWQHQLARRARRARTLREARPETEGADHARRGGRAGPHTVRAVIPTYAYRDPKIFTLVRYRPQAGLALPGAFVGDSRSSRRCRPPGPGRLVPGDDDVLWNHQDVRTGQRRDLICITDHGLGHHGTSTEPQERDEFRGGSRAAQAVAGRLGRTGRGLPKLQQVRPAALVDPVGRLTEESAVKGADGGEIAR
jgi:ribulose-5-phosphate 4-epimerase/fuculose-1-phosphate aldolase